MNIFNKITFLLITVISLCNPLIAENQPGYDWCKWRGPTGNSISNETDWTPAALTDKKSIAWKAEVGFGYSAISVKGDHVYTMGNKNKKDSVYCLSNKDGKEIWHYTYPCKPGSYSGPRATPVIDGNSLYTVSRDGLVLCLDALTGKLNWQKDLCKEANARIPTWGIASSVIIKDNMALVNVGKYGIALEKTTGETIWQSPKALCGYASPLLYSSAGKSCMIAYGQRAVYGVETATGKRLWKKEWITRMDEHSADPIIDGNKVYISSIYSIGSVVFDITDNQPKEIWQNTNLVNKFSTNVLYKGKLYGVHGNTGRRKGRDSGMLCCVDFQSGELLWEEPLGIGSVILVDDKLIVLNERGMLYIAKASPDGYQELSRTQVLKKGKKKREAKGKCWTAPSFSRGRLYCRNDRGEIVCIDMKKQ